MMMIKWPNTILAAVLVFGSAAYASPAKAQDGGKLVTKMEAAYRGLKSYSQVMKAAGKITIDGKTRTGSMSSEMRYRAPGRLYLAVTSPTAGTVYAVTDGKEQTVYAEKRKAYEKRAAPASVRAFVSGLQRHRIVAILDPLFFIAGETAGSLVSKFDMKGSETVEAALCDKVIGTLKPNAVQAAQAGRVIFWIDRKSSLLRKVSLELKGVPFRSATPGDPQSSPLAQVNMADQSVTETIRVVRVNPSLRDDELTVRLPRDAKPTP